MDKIQLTFVHPTESDRSITAAVPPDATAKTLITEMIRADFIAAPGNSAQYRLRDATTNRQLLDDTTLAAAGVTSGATLMVDHTTTGAGRA